MTMKGSEAVTEFKETQEAYPEGRLLIRNGANLCKNQIIDLLEFCCRI